ncbi:hypothetical protein [Planctomicrobium piriforme]|uniref:Uncharacterized protein n=1 Tax=Planctomicrobium piriforme TaxID=1576369 RepID=A0A1I3EBK2_9PLAN|nr:hypothetical protein [Planctomicrobium piriforme]SFH96269.1 hypothetical protein SAMN05421753_104151 [Planctomicrobium piriforme]
MPVTITPTVDLVAGTAELNFSDGEGGCVDATYLCNHFNGEAAQNSFFRQNNYTLPSNLCLGPVICVKGGFRKLAEDDGYASEEDEEFEVTLGSLSYFRTAGVAQYIAVGFDLSSLVGGFKLAEARLVLELESGSIGDDEFTVYRQSTFPTGPDDVDETEIASPTAIRSVKADDRLTIYLTPAVKDAIDSVPEGDPVGTVVFVIKIESTSESDAEVKFFSSRNVAEMNGPVLYLREQATTV